MSTPTIKYDRTVSNLIDELSETGHVTHTAFKKKSVTLHHNAGRLSHQGVLKVWQTRPASAHFDVDGSGAVAQYVKVNEYAWAAGSKQGNQESIHIEMANATLAPRWTVAEATWRGAARLAGWLFAKVIGEKPSKTNFFYHSHWSATACAGPFMDGIYERVLKAAQDAYESFKKPVGKPSNTTPAKNLKAVAEDVIEGKYGDGPERVRKLLAKGYNPEKVQDEVNKILNPKRGVKPFRQVADEVLAGRWGNDPERSRDLKAAGYDPASVQREVNLLVAERKRKR